MLVIQIVNSTYGVAGQIGFRARFIKARLDDLGINNLCLARDRGIGGPGVIQLLPFGQRIPRLLNAYRMFVDSRFDHRRYDRRIFEGFATRNLRKILQAVREQQVLIHLWEFSPGVIELAHSYHARVLLEVPIAPSHETLRLQRLGHFMDSPIEDIDPAEETAMQCADAILSPSEYVTGILKRIGVPEPKVFTNPFGCLVSRGVKIYRESGERLTFLFVGALSRRKGVEHLLHAWASGGFAKDRLVLCGRKMKSIRQRLHRLPVSNVETPGFVDVSPYLKQADVFVFPTLMEGSAKAVFEAMAAGLPVITTPNAGSIVDDGIEGLLVPIADPEALVRAMCFFKEHPKMIRQMGLRARAKASQYTWARYTDGAIQIYRQVLADPPYQGG